MNDGANQPPQPQPPYEQPTAQYTQHPPYGQLQYGQPQPQYGQPQYGQPPIYAQPQPQKRSLRWLWITLGVIGGIVVLGCAACGIAGVFGVNFVAQAVGPAVVSGQYYAAMSQQDYTKAYSYLDTSSISVQGQAVTQQAYAQAAQIVDTTQGKVTKSSSTGFNVTNDTATVTMSITRARAAYDVHLQLKKIGNDWKIVSMDRL
ncbi:MAG: hypothetical protein PVS3B3_10950 [Ktedonobacteraceae bacterium]